MIKENLHCHRCGKELDLIDEEIINEDGRGSYYRFICPNCGAIYEVDEPDEEEKKNYDFWKDEDISCRVGEEGDHVMNDVCINCGHKVYVTNNFMLSDCEGRDLPEDDDKMNYCINTCENCGCTELRWDNSENEKDNYPYWEEDCLLKKHLEGYSFLYLVNMWKKQNKKSDSEMVEILKNVINNYK